MSIGPTFNILTKIPWKEIAMTLPAVIEGLNKLNDIVRGYIPKKSEIPTSGKKEIKLSDLEERITNIELFEKEQSELIVQIGNQLGNVTSALQVVSKRVNYFIVVASVGFVIALSALILVLIK